MPCVWYRKIPDRRRINRREKKFEAFVRLIHCTGFDRRDDFKIIPTEGLQCLHYPEFEIDYRIELHFDRRVSKSSTSESQTYGFVRSLSKLLYLHFVVVLSFVVLFFPIFVVAFRFGRIASLHNISELFSSLILTRPGRCTSQRGSRGSSWP
mmetsp:Transcript_14967/g.30856  ORF Transcript_14967/g.30856 Transcript_14967/m.30856 type:complete len:152 (-) Transcript_14967:487-942(-)